MSSFQTNNQRIAKNTIFLYLRMLVVMLITFYTTRALLAVLGVDDYGLYNVVCGFVAMFGFLNTSMANGTQRFYNYEIGKKGEGSTERVYTHALVIQFAIALIIILVVETFGLWYLNNKMAIPEGREAAAKWVFQFSMLSLFFVIISVPYSAAIMAYERMHFFALVGIIDALLKLGIVFLLPILPNDSLIWYGALLSLISLIDLFLYFSYCKLNLKDIRIVKAIDKNLFVSMISFSGWNIFGSFAHLFRNQGVNLVFNAFWGTVVNAANGIAGQIDAAVNSLTQGFLTAIRPQMIKNYASGNEDHMIKMMFSASKLTFFLIMVLALPLISEISPILDLWLGRGKYPEITPVLCQLTIIMSLCNSYSTPISIVVHASGQMRKFQVICSIVVLSVVPLAYIAAKLGGSVEEIMIVSILIVIVTQVVRLFLVKEIVSFSIKEYAQKVILPCAIVLVFSATLTYAMHTVLPNGFTFSLIVIAASILIATILVLFIGLNEEERNLCYSILRKKSNK